MKLCVFTVCYNEAKVLPFFLRNYERYADQIFVWDDASTDGSRDILRRHPKVVLQDWPYRNGMDDDQFLTFAHATYPKARGKYDWAMWVDTDELVYAPDVPKILAAVPPQVQMLRTRGFCMVGDGMPKDDGRQAWEISPMGDPSETYSKPCVFRPSVNVIWNRGKHAIDGPVGASPVPVQSNLKLLHYRFLGAAYTKERNDRNFARVCKETGDKSAGWCCKPDFIGDNSPPWAEMIKTRAVNVLEV